LQRKSFSSSCAISCATRESNFLLEHRIMQSSAHLEYFSVSVLYNADVTPIGRRAVRPDYPLRLQLRDIRSHSLVPPVTSESPHRNVPRYAKAAQSHRQASHQTS